MNYRLPYKIDREKATVILKDAAALSNNVQVDQLDCSKSWARIKTDKTLDEILDIGLKDHRTLYNFIYRYPVGIEEEYFDVGLSTMASPSYFIWIKLDIKNGIKLINKYKLEPLI